MSRKISLFALALLSLSAPTWASHIYVSGDQTGTWAADSVIVTAEVRVPLGESLTILPGVEVLFSVYCKLIVDNGATLRAIGTPADFIRFDALPPNSYWHGIRFLAASDFSRLEYCNITHGYAYGNDDDNNGGAIYCYLSNPNICHNTITGNRAEGHGGGICCSHSSPIICDNDVTANDAYYGGGISSESGFSTLIARNNICSNSANGIGGGIYCLDVSGIAITNNTINQNDAIGIGGGIFCRRSSLLISNNTINGNSVNALSGGGIYCDSCSSAMIIGNMIVGNGSSGSGGGIYCSAISDLDINANTISANWAMSGGGMYCISSSASISGNFIGENASLGSGGGIFCSSNSSTLISDNVIHGNTIPDDGVGNGGGICCTNSNATISDNIITGNTISGEMGTRYGGGIYCTGVNSSIAGNTVSDNMLTNISGDNAQCHGAGIYCSGSSALIMDNLISGNEAGAGGYLSSSYGGGMYFYGPNSTIKGNTIYGNSAEGYFGLGGGIYCSQSSPAIIANTLSGNTTLGSGYVGGGLYCSNSNPQVVNCVFWGNAPGQITIGGSSNPQVTYSDVQYGYTGTGNINAVPLFVNTTQGDYRLQWGSPCIDTGDPNPFYNDPDGTRADMGAWYYDQSMPVRMLLTPYSAPIQIPAGGGSFQYVVQATNIGVETLPVLIWCNVTLPSGVITGPVLGPVRINLESGQTVSRVRMQNISAHAPAGLYHYNAYAVAVEDTSQDSFTFVKLGAGGWRLGVGGWSNTGESLETANSGEEGIYPLSFSLYPSFPNPFNPSTAISYQLSAVSFVNLSVYDVAGRKVAELVNSWREAGAHAVTFDGSHLPSGIYFAKLDAGDYSQVQKLILLK